MPTLSSGFVRRNGLELPLNGYQVGAYVAETLLLVSLCGVLAPNVPQRWRATAYHLPLAFFAAHLILLFVCTVLDPRDPGVRYDGAPRPTTIDRRKRKHVIIDQHCHFCQTKVRGDLVGTET